MISCVMATKDRPHLLARALGYFEAQTYPGRELIVVDDGREPVRELCEGRERVQYIRCTQPTTLGEKLNLGFESSSGELLQKLDDDDFYHPNFLRIAVETIEPADPAEDVVAAWDCFLLHVAGESIVRFSGFGRRAGSTLCFRREVWRRHRFRPLPRGVDSRFLRDSRAEILAVRAQEMHLVLRHGGNTWNTLRSGSSTDDWARSRSAYPKPLDEIVGPEAAAFYRSLPAA